MQMMVERILKKHVNFILQLYQRIKHIITPPGSSISPTPEGSKELPPKIKIKEKEC